MAKFRTPFNLGDYDDCTKFPSPDLVDTTGYEPLQDIISRMLSFGETPRLGSDFEFEGDEGSELLEDFSDVEDISEAAQQATELRSKLSEKASKQKQASEPLKPLKNANSENFEKETSGSGAEATVSATGAAAPRPEV